MADRACHSERLLRSIHRRDRESRLRGSTRLSFTADAARLCDQGMLIRLILSFLVAGMFFASVPVGATGKMSLAKLGMSRMTGAIQHGKEQPTG